MHHYIRYMQTGDRLKHSSIQLSSRNIVDYRDAVFFDATTCHIRPECIDRQGHIWIMRIQYFQGKSQTFHLLFR